MSDEIIDGQGRTWVLNREGTYNLTGPDAAPNRNCVTPYWIERRWGIQSPEWHAVTITPSDHPRGFRDDVRMRYQRRGWNQPARLVIPDPVHRCDYRITLDREDALELARVLVADFTLTWDELRG